MSDIPEGPDLYEDFVERYFECGEATVRPDWPEEVRERCLFFLKMVEQCLPPRSTGEGSACFNGLSAAGERYVIERELGRGGMGRVLLAYDRDLRRRVAMKVLPSPSRGAFTASRFLEEAQATAQLEHPNIGPVYDVGQEIPGQPFFTMKWIRGRNLEEILASGAR